MPTDSLDSGASATSKSNRTVRRSSKRGKLTAYSMWLPSSETCGSSFALAQVNAIGALRIWLREAFPANPSPSQENARRVPTPAIFGLSSPKWCGKFDPDTCSLRTCQDSLPGMEDATSGASLVTWPRSGTVSDGVCWELTMSVPRTGARGSGYWPTPRASANENRTTHDAPSHGTTHGRTLSGAVRGGPLTRQTYPTPTANDDNKSPEAHLRMKQRMGERDGTRANRTAITSLQVRIKADEGGGQLNPEWVEWLMGWPIGWTALEPLAMDRYQRWLRLHGEC